VVPIIRSLSWSLSRSRGVDRDTAIKRLNSVDWTLGSDLWRDVLITTSGLIAVACPPSVVVRIEAWRG
jgi:hypothetical protein